MSDDIAKVILPYILLLMLSLSATAQTKRALVIGFGMTDDEEINLYGAIDRKGKVVKKFTLKR